MSETLIPGNPSGMVSANGSEGQGKSTIPIFGKNIPRPDLPTRSFKDALSGNKSSIISPPELVCSSFRGMPAFLISDDFMAKLAAPFEFTLVGKFAFKRPSLEFIRKFFFNLKLSGSFLISLLDNRHVAIQLNNDLDYSRVFAHRSYYIGTSQMKLLKWTPFFDIKEESPIVPVWISFPNLRLHLINHHIIHAIASVFGRPLQTDQATASNSRPSLVRVLVEMDVSIKHPQEIWIGSELNGYTQTVEFENFPIFCPHCKIHGHDIKECFVLNPQLKSGKMVNKPVYRPKETSTSLQIIEDVEKKGNHILASHIECSDVHRKENEDLHQNTLLNKPLDYTPNEEMNELDSEENDTNNIDLQGDKGENSFLNKVVNRKTDIEPLRKGFDECVDGDSFVWAEKLKKLDEDKDLGNDSLSKANFLMNQANSNLSSQSTFNSIPDKNITNELDLEEGEVAGNALSNDLNPTDEDNIECSSLPTSPSHVSSNGEFPIALRKKGKKLGETSKTSQRVTRSASSNPKF